MEYVDGGELFNYIISQKRVKEPIARKMFRQIVSALEYCHKSNIIHRGTLFDPCRSLKPHLVRLEARESLAGCLK